MTKQPKSGDFWRSLGELEGSAELVARATEHGALEPGDPISRRRFAQLMGASFAFAGALGAGCRWEKDEIVPLAQRPEGRVPGVPAHYNTAMELGGAAIGLRVTAYDGRPIKIEGNSAHPFTGGASTTFAQASILELYDPDRGGRFIDAGKESSLANFTKLVRELPAETRLRVLSEASESPTVRALRGRVAEAFPLLQWHEWEPLSRDNEREGMRLAFGAPVRPVAAFDRARTILSLDGDFLVDHPAALRYARDWARRRRPEGVDAGAPKDTPRGTMEWMNRLYAVESVFSYTGAVADHRLPLRSELALPFAMALEAIIRGKKPPAAAFLAEPKVAAFLRAVAADLASAGSESLVVAGYRQPPELHAVVAGINDALAARTVSYVADPDPERPTHLASIRRLAEDAERGVVDALIILGGNPVFDAPRDLRLERALSRVALTAHLAAYEDETSARCTWHLPRAHVLEAWGDARAHDGTLSVIQPIIAPLRGGVSSIEVLAVLAAGGVFGTPPAKPAAEPGAGAAAEPGAGAGAGAAGEPGAGAAGEPGAGAGTDPIASPAAPAAPAAPAEPTPADAMAATAPPRPTAPTKIPTAESLVRETFAAVAGSRDWRRALHDGFVPETAYPRLEVSLKDRAAPALSERQRGGTVLANGALEVVFTPSSHTYDGRFANCGWLQETPDFMTKVTWDNVALIAPATAAALGVEHESVIRVLLTDEGGGREAVLPVYVMPGQAPFSLGIALGHGRTHAGHVGGLLAEDVAPIGADTYALRGTVALYIEGGGRILPTGARYPLASVQDHWAIDGVGQASIQRRLTDLVRTTTTREYAEPDFAYEPHGPPLESLFGTHDELTAGTPNHRWGMVTDLSSCIGCGACVVACQAENNIPIVGKEQVRRSREMHWLRIDRYFRGDPDDPEIAHQPLTCQHCENAPCEQVCPVGATIHSDEGLNDMVYNRCIGTRYCMNNCPYKVRRFNYFAYHGTEGGPNENLKDERNEIRKLLFNPEVTVRSRGVMEKCTFCVQRIEAAKIAANNANGGKGRPLADGEVVTACMQACPTGAIVFGDLGDPESQVSRLADPGRFRRGYALLAELHASPRNTYLARVRNPNPELG